MSAFDRVTGWPHWTTPEHFIERVRRVNDIGLDPCSNASSRVAAYIEISGDARREGGVVVSRGPTLSDGLASLWAVESAPHGLVYCNPPYGGVLAKWTRKMREEGERGAEIVALFPSRTDTRWMHRDVFASADAGLFWKGRIKFDNPPPPVCRRCGQSKDSNPRHDIADDERHPFDPKPGTNAPTVPSFVAYWGRRLGAFADAFGDAGHLWRRGTS